MFISLFCLSLAFPSLHEEMNGYSRSVHVNTKKDMKEDCIPGQEVRFRVEELQSLLRFHCQETVDRLSDPRVVVLPYMLLHLLSM